MKEIQPKSILRVQAGDFHATKKFLDSVLKKCQCDNLPLPERQYKRQHEKSVKSSTIQGPDFIASDGWTIRNMSHMGLANYLEK